MDETGWVPQPIWTGAENLAPIAIRSPDRPACIESVHRLRYPSPPPFEGGFRIYPITYTPILIDRDDWEYAGINWG